MIFKSGIDTVNYRYSDKVRFMERLNISRLAGRTYRIVGFIYRQYDDGYRCFFVTDDEYLIRLPKWYSQVLNNMTIDDLEELKSCKYLLTNIHNITGDNGKFTTHFDLVLDNSVPFGPFNF